MLFVCGKTEGLVVVLKRGNACGAKEPCLLYADSERGIYRLQNKNDITEERAEIPEAFALNTGKLHIRFDEGDVSCL